MGKCPRKLKLSSLFCRLSRILRKVYKFHPFIVFDVNQEPNFGTMNYFEVGTVQVLW